MFFSNYTKGKHAYQDESGEMDNYKAIKSLLTAVLTGFFCLISAATTLGQTDFDEPINLYKKRPKKTEARFKAPLFHDVPIPHRVVRLDYRYSLVKGSNRLSRERIVAHEIQQVTGYAFNKNIGIEYMVPYVFRNRDYVFSYENYYGFTYFWIENRYKDRNDFGNMKIKLKFALYELETVIIGFGITGELPTGNHHKDIGSCYLGSVEPYLTLGYAVNNLELSMFTSVNSPVGTRPGDAIENRFNYGMYLLFPFVKYIDMVLEFTGLTYLNGGNKGFTTLSLAPGVRAYPFKGGMSSIGIGINLPVYKRTYEIEILSSIVYYF